MSNELKGAVISQLGSVKAFAEAMGISQPTAARKLDGESAWTLDEINKARKLLNISWANVPRYFKEATK